MNAIKPKVQLYGIKPEMVMVDSVVKSVFKDLGFDCVVTSGVGMKHAKRSLHYPGYALDYRTKHITPAYDKRNVVKALQKALPCCDVILEHEGEAQEHIHCEYDPKDEVTNVVFTPSTYFIAQSGVGAADGSSPDDATHIGVANAVDYDVQTMSIAQGV